MSGRKQGVAYELYGFTPKILSGKHMAVCKFCHRTLKNTAATRLHKHRNSCVGTAQQNANAPSNVDNKLPKKTVKDDAKFEAEQIDNINFNNEDCKREFSLSIDDDIAEQMDNQMNVMDIMPTIQTIKQRSFQVHENSNSDLLKPLKTPTQKAKVENLNVLAKAKIKVKSLPRKRLLKNIPASSHIKMKKISNNNNNNNNDNDDMTIIENAPNNFNGSAQLHKQLAKLEMMYYHKKAEYIAQLIEQTKMKKTLMLLELQKLQLEIQTINKK